MDRSGAELRGQRAHLRTGHRLNSHRILVTAERVVPTPPDAGKEVDAVGFPWWAVGVLLTLAAAVVYLVRDAKAST